MMKTRQLLLAAFAALSMALGAHAQLKVGSNPTTTSASANLEVEATDGKKVKVNKLDGKFYIENKPTATKTDSVMMRFTDGEVRQMSINRLLGQLDLDGDGIVDAEDPDIDGDGILNAADNCPRQYCPTAPGCPASCVSSPSTTVIVNCNTAGFAGTYVAGTTLNGATYSVTITNNSFSTVSLTMQSSNLQLSDAALTIGTPSPATLNLNAGQSGTITYPINGTPASSCGTLQGVWTLLSLNCTKIVPVSPPDFSLPATSIAYNSLGEVSGFTANWTPQSGVTGYTLEHAASPSGPWTAFPSNPYSSNSAAVTGLSGNYAYYVRVTLIGGSCSGGYATTVAGCAVKVSASSWQVFMCHDLGADRSVDPHIPSVGIHGAYILWGRRGPNTTGDSRVDWQTAVNSSALAFIAAPTSTDSNAGSIAGWSPSAGANGSWLTTAGGKGPNDPCPSGYRVPTAAIMNNVTANNTYSKTGPFILGSANYNSAVHLSPGGDTKISFPMNGYRQTLGGPSGALLGRGSGGLYFLANDDASTFAVNSTSAFVGGGSALDGYGLRCIKE